MAYASFQDVDQLLDTNFQKRCPKALFEICARKADSIIDARLASIYDTPFTTTPALVQNIAEDLTLYYILRSNYFAGVAGNDEEMRRELWKTTMALLDDIVSGETILPDVDPSDANKRLEQIGSTHEDYHPAIDMGDERLWGPDEDMVEIDEDERRG